MGNPVTFILCFTFLISISVTLSMAWPDLFVTFRWGGGVIPLPGRGIVGKNRSAWSKTTVRIIQFLQWQLPPVSTVK